MHPYKTVIVQKLDPKDKPKRKVFAELMLQNFDTGTCPLHNIPITDKAHFYLSSDVNHQNCRFWVTENPQIAHEKLLRDS